MKFILTAALMLALSPTIARASVCGAIPVPPELGLECIDEPGNAVTPPSATISPETSLFSAFTGLTIRRLPQSEDSHDPQDWLRRQVTLDLSGLGSFFSDLAENPDLPAQNDGLAQSLEETGSTISSLGNLPLSGCGTAEIGPAKSDLTCHWDTGGLGLDMRVRLVTAGDQRYALRAWSMNDRRFMQLQALMNGFDPDKVS